MKFKLKCWNEFWFTWDVRIFYNEQILVNFFHIMLFVSMHQLRLNAAKIVNYKSTCSDLFIFRSSKQFYFYRFYNVFCLISPVKTDLFIVEYCIKSKNFPVTKILLSELVIFIYYSKTYYNKIAGNQRKIMFLTCFCLIRCNCVVFLL